MRRLYGATILALTGCAFPHALERVAIDENAVVARTTDTVALLNILRARDGLPLHFTSFTRLSGNVDFAANASAGASVGLNKNGGDNSLSLGTGASIGSNPNFDVAIHDGQEFQRGILQPIAPTTINYYLRQGWRRDLLTYLLVRRVEFTIAETPPEGSGLKKGDVVAAIDNVPDQPDDAARFRNFVRCYTLAPASRPGSETPLLAVKDTAKLDIGDLAKIDGDKLDLGKGPGGKDGDADWIVRLSAAGETVKLMRTESAPADCATNAGVAGRSAETRLQRLTLAAPGNRNATLAHAEVIVEVDGKPVKVVTSVDMIFRSAEGVIYFLGEYAREASVGRHPYVLSPHAGTAVGEPLLILLPGRGDRYDLTATLNGKSWHVPTTGAGRSYQVITLVEQLFNLQKAGAAGPQSVAVRVLN